MKIALKITYDGTNFCGWQKQPNKRSVQEEIEFAIFGATGCKVALFSSGRTDAGVHALGQIAHFEIDKQINVSQLVACLNAYLPSDVKIINAWIAQENFDARYTAKQKTYIYRFYASRFEYPLKIGRELRVNDYVNINAMRKTLPYLIGTKDFRSFVARKSGKTDFVRTIIDAKINQLSDFEFEFEITGNGFLYNMVRIIMGTLLLVGYGKREPEDVEKIIEKKDRTLAGKTMPAFALYLKEVKY